MGEHIVEAELVPLEDTSNEDFVKGLLATLENAGRESGGSGCKAGAN